MTAFMRPLFAQDFHPHNAPIAAIDGEGDELVAVGDGHTVVDAGRIIINGFLRLADRHGGQHVNRIAEDDGRRMSFARQRDFPTDIVGLAPVDRWIGVQRNTVGQRPTPLRPVVRERRGVANGSTIRQRGYREQAAKK